MAIAMMVGAIGAHFGPVGFEGDFLGVFIAAVVALVAAITTGVMEMKLRQAADH